MNEVIIKKADDKTQNYSWTGTLWGITRTSPEIVYIFCQVSPKQFTLVSLRGGNRLVEPKDSFNSVMEEVKKMYAIRRVFHVEIKSDQRPKD